MGRAGLAPSTAARTLTPVGACSLPSPRRELRWASHLEEMAAWLPPCLPAGKVGVRMPCPGRLPSPTTLHPQTHRAGELLRLPGRFRGGAELLGVSVSLCLQGAGPTSPPRPWHPQCQPLGAGDARWACPPRPLPSPPPGSALLTEPVFASCPPRGVGSSPGPAPSAHSHLAQVGLIREPP